MPPAACLWLAQGSIKRGVDPHPHSPGTQRGMEILEPQQSTGRETIYVTLIILHHKLSSMTHVNLVLKFDPVYCFILAV